MAFLNINDPGFSTSLSAAANVDSVNIIIDTVIASEGIGTSEYIFSKISPNGDLLKTIYVNDSFVTAINAIDTLTANQQSVITAALYSRSIDENYDLIYLLAKELFDIDTINTSGTTALTTARSVNTKPKKDDLYSYEVTLLDAISFIILVGKMAITDSFILGLVDSLINTIVFGRSKYLGALTSINYLIDNQIIANGSTGAFTDSIDAYFTPGLTMAVEHLNSAGATSIASASKTIALDGTLAIPIEKTANGYVFNDELLSIKYVFEINTSYALSTLYTYNTYLATKFTNIGNITIISDVKVNEL